MREHHALQPHERASRARRPAGAGRVVCPARASALTRAEREQAVIQTIQNSDWQTKHSDACSKISFYWEIGNATQMLAHGQNQNISQPPDRGQELDIASASKWIYAAYVAQKRGGQLNADDIPALNNTTGFIDADRCTGLEDTVDECLAEGVAPVTAYQGEFVYVPTNDQWHAIIKVGLGDKNAAELRSAMKGVLNQGLQTGQKIDFTFEDPAPAYGINMNTAEYAQFLQNILGGYLQIGNLLGTNAVLADCPPSNPPGPGNLRCTNANSPVAKMLEEKWHYSIGHWVEDDPNGSLPNGDDPGDRYNDGAFSSPGALGYYPWITADKTYYGILARRSSLLFEPRAAAKSVRCGRKIRRAWMTGVAQPPPGS